MSEERVRWTERFVTRLREHGYHLPRPEAELRGAGLLYDHLNPDQRTMLLSKNYLTFTGESDHHYVLQIGSGIEEIQDVRYPNSYMRPFCCLVPAYDLEGAFQPGERMPIAVRILAKKMLAESSREEFQQRAY